jgi:RNA polymerase sigma-70 factor (ECF subfamily)
MPHGAANSPGPHSGSARRAEFEALYGHHSREVWALAYARWMDPDLAMDVTQEAFLRLWKYWETARPSEEDIQNPRAWLLRVARNLAEDYAKSAFRRNGTQPPELLNGVRSTQPMPLEVLEREELFGQLRGILDDLSPADRDILTLRYALDYDANSIAETLGVNVTAVHMRLSRARQRVADRLNELDNISPGLISGNRTES